jgi:hypothetical protein
MKYLVTIQSLMDDVPIRLCNSLDDARACAAETDWEIPEEIARRLHLPDISTQQMVSIVVFGDDGKPLNRIVVKEKKSVAG